MPLPPHPLLCRRTNRTSSRNPYALRVLRDGAACTARLVACADLQEGEAEGTCGAKERELGQGGLSGLELRRAEPPYRGACKRPHRAGREQGGSGGRAYGQ